MLRLQRFSQALPFAAVTKSCVSNSSSTNSYQHAPWCVHTAYRFGSSATSPQIFRSKFPSQMAAIDAETSLYSYMTKRWAAADPAKPALIQAETSQQLTYGELGPTAEVIAHLLYSAGVRKGDVVSVAMLNNIFYAPIFYGILRVGGVVSTINVVGAPSTLAYHFKTNKCKVVLGQKFFQKNIEAAANIAEREAGEKIRVLYPEDFMRMRAADLPAEKMPKDYRPHMESKPDDTVYIPFSSGTTGMPKGVQLTNRNMIANIEQVRVMFRTTSTEVSLTVLPLFHVFAQMCSCQLPMAVNATQVVMAKYSVEAFTDTIAKHKVTLVGVAPPIIVSLVKNQDKFANKDLSSLQAIRSGSAPLPAELEHLCEKIFPGVSCGQGYGMTEMSPVVAAVPRDEIGGDRIYGSSGKLAPDTELRVVNVDDSQQSGADKSAGIDCAPGESGEIWTRGPQMFKGYLNDEDTAKTMQDGWYRTGDIGTFDEKTGYLTITDRLKELIKYKGFQVSPASVEAMLLSHPWVADCIVVGVPDQRDVSFENPRALVVLKKGLPFEDAVRASDELYRFVMARSPPHKRLHGGVRVVDVIPRNDAGKVMRRQIRTDEIAFINKGIEKRAAAGAAEGSGSAAATA